MTLDVLFLHTQPRMPTRESFEVAGTFWLESRRPRSETTNVEVATLAIALDLGFSWMIQSVRDFYKETPLYWETVDEIRLDGTNGLLSKVDLARMEVLPVANYMKDVAHMIWSLLPTSEMLSGLFLSPYISTRRAASVR